MWHGSGLHLLRLLVEERKSSTVSWVHILEYCSKSWGEAVQVMDMVAEILKSIIRSISATFRMGESLEYKVLVNSNSVVTVPNISHPPSGLLTTKCPKCIVRPTVEAFYLSELFQNPGYEYYQKRSKKGTT